MLPDCLSRSDTAEGSEVNNASAARARRGINTRGTLVSFRRLTSTLPQTVAFRADVKVVGAGYALSDLTNGVSVGTRKIIVSKLDLAAHGFPEIVKGDRVYIGAAFDTWVEIQAIDDVHREYNGCLDLTIKGK